MATPRYKLVDPEIPLFYHLVSSCVRDSYLLGFDRRSGKDYSYRKARIINRLKQLGSAFAVDIYAYAIMSNHFHLIVYYDPLACYEWSDEEVVERWLRACPPCHPDGTRDEDRYRFLYDTYLEDRQGLEKKRMSLGDMSDFMKFLKQPIAYQSNKEDGCSGSFFSKRFYSGAILDEEGVLAAMAYVDLNPVRAKIARSLAGSDYTSVHQRVQVSSADALEAYLEPVISGLNKSPVVKITLKSYINRLQSFLPGRKDRSNPNIDLFTKQMLSFKTKQRAYGSEAALCGWLAKRVMLNRESPLPS